VQLHELGHWSGAEIRLRRDLSGSFGSADYAREELRAELAQVMLCADLGIEDCDFTNGAAYIAHWLDRLRNDKREVIRAASDAQRIADYLLAFHPDYIADPLQHDVESEQSSDDTPSSLAEAA
jgi:antirestriction protein ArdC